MWWPRLVVHKGPRRYVGVLMGVGLVIGMGLMIVGSGGGDAQIPFGDTGMPTGDPRPLLTTGRRVRNLTEEEYQRTQEWAG